LIRSNKITEVRIYITSGQKNNKNKSDTLVKVTNQKYIKELFTFNKDGYAVHNRTYYLNRQNHYYSFNRDAKNNIVQHVSQFFDSAGKLSNDPKPDITDYTFDEYGDIVKRKKREPNGNSLPDEKSEYTITEYNEQGWKKKETTHYYWDWETPPEHLNTTYYTYTNKGKTETAKTFDGKKLSSTTITNYDDNGAPLSISSFNHFLNKQAYKKVFKYDSLGRLIKYVTSSVDDYECPGKGNFSNEFKYNSVGLLIEQRHVFANTPCILQFEYK
jgi:phage terminase large subunit-like protein